MRAEFYYNKRKFLCGLFTTELSKELRIRNDRGEVLAIEQGKKFGLQGKRRESSREVDASQPYLYNLIKAAVSALEIADKNQLLIEKDRIIDGKDEQINNLNQQLNILNTTHILTVEQEQKLCQLQDVMQERIAIIEAQNQRIAQLENELRASPVLPLESIEKKVKTKLGESVWSYLHPSSRRDLCSAYKNYLLIKSEKFTAQVADYSEAGRSLGIVAEREIVAPFFADLYHFVSGENKPATLLASVPCEGDKGRSNYSAHQLSFGSIPLKSKGEYTLGDLPALLSTQWETFIKNALDQEDCLPEDKLYRTVFMGNQVSQTDRQLIQQFYQEWQHPLSRWLAKGQASASAIDKIRQLRNRASHAEPILYLWQFKELWSLVVGGKKTRGVLQEIYGGLSLRLRCSEERGAPPAPRSSLSSVKPS